MSEPDGLADDYLHLLKGAIAHTLYGEVDGGVHYRRNLAARALFALLALRNITPVRTGARAASHRADGRDWPLFAQTMIGTARLDNLQACVENVLRSGVPGDLVETGVWRGGASIFMRGILKARGDEGRLVWVCDSFAGLPKPDPAFPADVTGPAWHTYGHLGVSLPEVQANFERYGLLDDNVRFAKGWFKDTLPALSDRTWAVIRLDGDMYESTMDALTHLYPGLSPGGYLIVDDYSIEACRQAIHDYRAAHGVTEPIKTIDWTGAFWQRAPAAAPAAASHQAREREPAP